MEKDPNKAPLLFDWLNSHGSNLWRLMGFSLLSGLFFVGMFYSISTIDTNPPVEVVHAHRIVSLDSSDSASQPHQESTMLQRLERDLFLASEGDDSFRSIDPQRFELPFAQHHATNSPKLLELRQEVKREIPTGLLVVTEPVLPPASALSLPLAQFRQAPEPPVRSKIAVQMSDALKTRFIGELPQALGAELLGAQSYMKFLIGLNSAGRATVAMPISQIDMPSEGSHYAKLLSQLQFKPSEPKHSMEVSWGHLVISWEDETP